MTLRGGEGLDFKRGGAIDNTPTPCNEKEVKETLQESGRKNRKEDKELKERNTIT